MNVQFKIIHRYVVEKTRVWSTDGMVMTRKRNILRKTCPSATLVQHKCHMDRSGIKSGPSEVRRSVTIRLNRYGQRSLHQNRRANCR